MAVLVIRIEESREAHEYGQEMVGFSLSNDYDGDLQVGDVLPGMRPLIMRAVQKTIDAVWGSPVVERVDLSEEALDKAFIH